MLCEKCYCSHFPQPVNDSFVVNVSRGEADFFRRHDMVCVMGDMHSEDMSRELW